MTSEIWFKIVKDKDGFPASRDFEGLICEIEDEAEGLAKVKSVPFYLREVAFDDIIRFGTSPSGYREFSSVVQRSGYSVYRLFIDDKSCIDKTIQELLDFDLILERDKNLLALGVPPHINHEPVVSYILEGKMRGLWGAQDGYIAD